MSVEAHTEHPRKRPGPPQTFGHNSHNYQTIGKRQREIIWLLSTGKQNKDIAELLGIHRITVERHLQRAREATGCPTTMALIGHCLRKGIIQ